MWYILIEEKEEYAEYAEYTRDGKFYHLAVGDIIENSNGKNAAAGALYYESTEEAVEAFQLTKLQKQWTNI
jgi:hypothetical protein